eukprot:scpid88345/ scgid27992/ 
MRNAPAKTRENPLCNTYFAEAWWAEGYFRSARDFPQSLRSALKHTAAEDPNGCGRTAELSFSLRRPVVMKLAGLKLGIWCVALGGRFGARAAAGHAGRC